MAERIYRERELDQVDGLSRSTRRRLIAEGRYPRPINLGGSAYLVGWLASSVERWIQDQVEASRRERLPLEPTAA